MSMNQKNAANAWTDVHTWAEILRTHAKSLVGPDFYSREDERHRCDGVADVAITTAPRPISHSVITGCVLIEASAGGISLQAGSDLPQGARVTMRVRFGEDQARINGTIVYCKRVSMTKYRVGIRLRFAATS